MPPHWLSTFVYWPLDHSTPSNHTALPFIDCVSSRGLNQAQQRTAPPKISKPQPPRCGNLSPPIEHLGKEETRHTSNLGTRNSHSGARAGPSGNRKEASDVGSAHDRDHQGQRWVGAAGNKLSALGYFRLKHLPLISKDTKDLPDTTICCHEKSLLRPELLVWNSVPLF